MMRLTRTDPTKNMHRYYRLSIQPDLFGGYNLMREWGRIGRGGQLRQEHFESKKEAQDAMIALAGIKQQRGYQRRVIYVNDMGPEEPGIVVQLKEQ